MKKIFLILVLLLFSVPTKAETPYSQYNFAFFNLDKVVKNTKIKNTYFEYERQIKDLDNEISELILDRASEEEISSLKQKKEKIVQEHNKYMEKSLKDVNMALKKLSEEKNIDIVFTDKSIAAHSNNIPDITDDVIAYLNKQESPIAPKDDKTVVEQKNTPQKVDTQENQKNSKLLNVKKDLDTELNEIRNALNDIDSDISDGDKPEAKAENNNSPSITNNNNSDKVANINSTNAKLDASNYQSYEPDFVFKDSSPFTDDKTCEDELSNLYCIPFKYGKLGKAPKVKKKYLEKVIKTPLLIWSTISNDDGSADITDLGFISEYQPSSEAIYCHIEDEDNIDKFVSETKQKRTEVEVIGKVSKIRGYDGLVVLDPCFYIETKDKK